VELFKRKHVPKACWSLACAALLLLSACHLDDIVDAGGGYTATESFSFEIEVFNQHRFRIEAINGPIDITGVPDAETVLIWGERRVTSESSSDARKYLDNLEVNISESNDEVSVKTIQPKETHGRNLEIIYHVLIPDQYTRSVYWGAKY